MATTVTIPGGAKIKITRVDGSEEKYTLRGTDGKGLILEDENGQRGPNEIGVYKAISVDTSHLP
ncbi:hypothetical protein [Roseateles sp.]|uniref:hypothetical protein n=1 Tax=Roseateles sp. TaxID=1971397 RepID=UPI0031D0E169